MRLKDLNYDEILKRVLASDKLRERFDGYVQECEMDYISEKLACFTTRCADWSIGPYNHNYFRCKEPNEFVYCARKMVDNYGASDSAIKALTHCEKLRGTNLFDHHVDKLAALLQRDFIEECDGIEDVCYQIYCEKPTPMLRDFIECFADNYLDDVMIDDDSKCYRIQYL